MNCVMMSPGVITCRFIMTAGRSSLTSGVTATSVTFTLSAGVNAQDTRWSPHQVRQVRDSETDRLYNSNSVPSVCVRQVPPPCPPPLRVSVPLQAAEGSDTSKEPNTPDTTGTYTCQVMSLYVESCVCLLSHVSVYLCLLIDVSVC